eukprot:3999172-Pleurochrysis_carterae.AAC.1
MRSIQSPLGRAQDVVPRRFLGRHQLSSALYPLRARFPLQTVRARGHRSLLLERRRPCIYLLAARTNAGGASRIRYADRDSNPLHVARLSGHTRMLPSSR